MTENDNAPDDPAYTIRARLPAPDHNLTRPIDLRTATLRDLEDIAARSADLLTPEQQIKLSMMTKLRLLERSRLHPARACLAEVSEDIPYATTDGEREMLVQLQYHYTQLVDQLDQGLDPRAIRRQNVLGTNPFDTTDPTGPTDPATKQRDQKLAATLTTIYPITPWGKETLQVNASPWDHIQTSAHLRHGLVDLPPHEAAALERWTNAAKATAINHAHADKTIRKLLRAGHLLVIEPAHFYESNHAISDPNSNDSSPTISDIFTHTTDLNHTPNSPFHTSTIAPDAPLSVLQTARNLLDRGYTIMPSQHEHRLNALLKSRDHESTLDRPPDSKLSPDSPSPNSKSDRAIDPDRIRSGSFNIPPTQSMPQPPVPPKRRRPFRPRTREIPDTKPDRDDKLTRDR